MPDDSTQGSPTSSPIGSTQDSTIDSPHKVFKSSPASMSVNFFKLSVLALILEYCAFFLVKPQAENVPMIIRVEALETVSPLDILPLLLVVAVLLAAYLAFIRNNIRIEINDNSIAFFRRKKKYLDSPLSPNNFFLCSKKKITNIFPFYLQSFLIFAGRHKRAKNKCYNFSQKTFSEMDLLVRSNRHKQARINYSKLLQTTENQDIRLDFLQYYHGFYLSEHLNLLIPKEAILRDTKVSVDRKYLGFVVLTVTIGLFQYFYDTEAYLSNLAVNLSFTIALASVSLLALILAFVYPRRRIVKHTPSQISLTAKSISFDNQVFHFSEIDQIRLTPPVTPQNAGSRLLWIRIVTNESTTPYLVGERLGIQDQSAWFIQGKDPNSPANYETICWHLEAYLSEEPAKLYYEVG